MDGIFGKWFESKNQPRHGTSERSSTGEPHKKVESDQENSSKHENLPKISQHNLELIRGQNTLSPEVQEILKKVHLEKLKPGDKRKISIFYNRDLRGFIWEIEVDEHNVIRAKFLERLGQEKK